MDKAIATQWVAALRSGKYKQGHGELRSNYLGGAAKFCCLGVLCNLHAAAHPDIAALQTDPGVYLGDSALLPAQVQDWAGLKSNDGTPNLDETADGEFTLNNHQYTDLADANDDGVSFKRIATWIEKNYERL